MLRCGQRYCDVPASPSSARFMGPETCLWPSQTLRRREQASSFHPSEAPQITWHNFINRSFRRPRCPLPALLQLFMASAFLTLVGSADKQPGHCCLVALLPVPTAGGWSAAVRDANACQPSQQLFSSADEGEPSRRVQDRAGTLGCLVFSDTYFICSLIRSCLLADCISKPLQGCSKHPKNAPVCSSFA